MTGPESPPEDEELVVAWDEFEQATDLIVADRKKGQPRDPVNSR